MLGLGRDLDDGDQLVGGANGLAEFFRPGDPACARGNRHRLAAEVGLGLDLGLMIDGRIEDVAGSKIVNEIELRLAFDLVGKCGHDQVGPAGDDLRDQLREFDVLELGREAEALGDGLGEINVEAFQLRRTSVVIFHRWIGKADRDV
ncbi:hypothetical protein D3C87_1630280 [compost metagenome]